MGLKVSISIHAGVVLIFTVLLLTIPIPNFFCVLLAVCIHELSHVLTGLLLGGTLSKIVIFPTCAVIKIDALSADKALAATFAGPISSLCLVLLFRRLPLFALCGGIQGLFNLLPIYPLDGGRIIRLLQERFRKNALH